jgi:hypothetical protein
VNFSGEILHGENLPELVYRMFVICLFSRCWSHCTRRETLRELKMSSLKVPSLWVFSGVGIFLGSFFLGGGIFHGRNFHWELSPGETIHGKFLADKLSRGVFSKQGYSPVTLKRIRN